VQTSGYLQVDDRAPAIAADRTDLERSTRSFMRSDLASQGVYPGITFADGLAPLPTFVGVSPPVGPAGQVIEQGGTLEHGVFGGTVEVTRPAVVLLKASYDPRWTATVDGLPVKPVMMAPSLVGVDVPAGRHDVTFTYEPYDRYPLLLALGLLTFIVLVVVPRRDRLLMWASAKRRSAQDPDDAVAPPLSAQRR